MRAINQSLLDQAEAPSQAATRAGQSARMAPGRALGLHLAVGIAIWGVLIAALALAV